ncbi:hypothetical protein [Streptomyces sp. NPDC087294]|uniref:hypothetical protein n=1 Tax=Streptomyces sp. NPDC087294 TaxID=3365777 RepID=UPI00380AD00F
MSRTSVAFLATTAICNPGVRDRSRTASPPSATSPQPRPVSSNHTAHFHKG